MRNYLDVVYDAQIRPRTDYPKQLAQHLFEKFGFTSGQRFVEVGCGRGEFLSCFAELGLRVSGVDLDPTAKSLNPDLDISFCDVEKAALPFEDDSVDVVFSKSFLEHLGNPEAYFEEAFRVLKPGGLMVTLVPDWDTCMKTYFDDHTHKIPYTKYSLCDLYKMKGFSNVGVVKFRQLPLLWKYPVLNYVSAFLALFTPERSRVKFLKWSRELMLVGEGRKPR